MRYGSHRIRFVKSPRRGWGSVLLARLRSVRSHIDRGPLTRIWINWGKVYDSVKRPNIGDGIGVQHTSEPEPDLAHLRDVVPYNIAMAPCSCKYLTCCNQSLKPKYGWNTILPAKSDIEDSASCAVSGSKVESKSSPMIWISKATGFKIWFFWIWTKKMLAFGILIGLIKSTHPSNNTGPCARSH